MQDIAAIKETQRRTHAELAEARAECQRLRDQVQVGGEVCVWVVVVHGRKSVLRLQGFKGQVLTIVWHGVMWCGMV